MVKKIVAAKVLLVVSSAIGSKLVGISIGYIIAPLIAAFLAYEYFTLPSKMADKISENVSVALRSKFSDLNKNVASGIVAELGTAALGTFASDVVNDISMKKLIDSL